MVKRLQRYAFLLVASIVIVLMACGSDGTKGSQDGLAKAAFRAPTFIGYGVVNHWHRVDAIELSESLAVNGLTLTGIEYIPWFDGDDCGCKHNGGCSTFPYVAEFEHFVDEMRRNAITTFVNIVNWNNCAIRKVSDQWFRDRIEEVLSVGPDLLILQAVSEPWVRTNSTPRRWTEVLLRETNALFAIPDQGRNHATGKPYFTGIAHDFLDVHPCSDDAAFDAIRRKDLGTIVNTDCTGVLNPGPDRAAELTYEAVTNNTHLLIYDFRGPEIDNDVIHAMGASVEAALRDSGK